MFGFPALPSKATLDANLGFWTHGTLLVDGRVLIASYKTTDVDVYDPTDSMKLFAATPVTGGYPVRLRDGTVLLIGDDDYNGDLKCAVFDSDVNTFTPVGSVKTATRAQFSAHTLPSGKVIVLGGGQWPAALASIELYDPAAKTFSVAAYSMSIARDWHASALVRDGTVIVVGGYTGSSCRHSRPSGSRRGHRHPIREDPPSEHRAQRGHAHRRLGARRRRRRLRQHTSAPVFGFLARRGRRAPAPAELNK